MEKVNYKTFAQMLDVHPRTVTRYVKSGKLSGDSLFHEEGKATPWIVVEKALKQLESNTSIAHQMSHRVMRDTIHAKQATGGKQSRDVLNGKSQSETASANGSGSPPVKKVGYGSDSERFAKARAESEEHKAKLAKLKIQEQEGKLVDARVIQKKIYKLVGETRESLLNIPDNVGPELLACNDLLELQTRLTEAINQALMNLSRFAPQDEEENEES